ncbi:MAG TPA: Asd/ArgC dimerization domain-containing protein [Gaiellaceae bacterium]|nr:Asd/ArgC dimerization domain-containing protein [Gaiellaceae bacterium]
MPEPRIAVVGATGAVGGVTLRLLKERGYAQVRAFASPRSAGRELDGGVAVEVATPEALAAGDIDLAFFSVGTGASRELVPHVVRGGAVAVDKSAAYRLQDGIPLVVPEVNGERALEHDGIVANPNCCAIPLTMALKPLHDAAGLARVRVSTYQSVSGAGAQRMAELRATPSGEGNLAMDWDFDGEEFDEESKLRDETRKILELPELPISATCLRVPVLIGHAEAVWLETEEPLSASDARGILEQAPGLRLENFPTPRDATGIDDVLVGRIRRDPTVANGLVFLVVADNLRKGAALNAIQIAELILERRAVAA